MLRAFLCFIAFIAFMGAQYGAIYERDEVSKILAAYGVGLLALITLFVMAPGKPALWSEKLLRVRLLFSLGGTGMAQDDK